MQFEKDFFLHRRRHSGSQRSSKKNRDIYDERKIIKEFLIIVNLYCNLTFVINVLEEVGVNKLFIRTMTTQLRRLSSCFKFISQKNAFH